MIRQAWALNRMKMLGAAVLAQVAVDAGAWASGALDYRPAVARYVAMVCLGVAGILTGRRGNDAAP